MKDKNLGSGTLNSIEVASVDDYLKKIENSGGKAIKPKIPIPGVGCMVFCKDTEGNVFGIMHNDPNAK